MDIDELLTRGVSEILPDKSGLEKIMAGKKIRVYLGVDATGPHLHLGHTIPLRKLNEFAQAGHEAILLFGTGTVLAGDPSQRAHARAKITQKEIDENIKTWKDQAGKVVDLSKVQIKQNGDWLLKLTYADILNIASNISSVQLFKREMFQRRIEAGDTVWTQETLYPLFQGYDSVAMDVDLEIGGTDQTFNMLIGRELQKKMNNREKYVLITPLISGTDGKPMSKSSGNCIWLDDSPGDMFGKIMAIADNEIESYWVNLTGLPKEDLRPMDAKKKLAFEIVKTYHGESEAKKAQEKFEQLFQKGGVSESTPEIKLSQPSVELVDFLVENNLAPSKSEAKRLIANGAIEVDGQTISEDEIEFTNNQVMRVGKKKFVRITIE
ncbi:MAG: tyrosine--tRNA ligase [Candidatus Curtissbacteria bacterium]|nr:tyrosine--tRNA ligase [Candidatus Curtissbacteria bacterium]